MIICTKCNVAAEDAVCPVCKRKKYLKEAEDGDLVIVATTDFLTSSYTEDLLNEAGIKFIKKGTLGSAVTAYIGELSETYNFYVMAKDYEEATSVIPNFELDEEFEEN